MGIFRKRKSRKYPIQYDDRGQSLRTRCFQLFDELMRPVEVTRELGMKESTAERYFYDWKGIGPNFERKYSYVQGLLKKTNPNRGETIRLFAKAYR